MCYDAAMLNSTLIAVIAAAVLLASLACSQTAPGRPQTQVPVLTPTLAATANIEATIAAGVQQTTETQPTAIPAATPLQPQRHRRRRPPRQRQHLLSQPHQPRNRLLLLSLHPRPRRSPPPTDTSSDCNPHPNSVRHSASDSHCRTDVHATAHSNSGTDVHATADRDPDADADSRTSAPGGENTVS